MGHMLLWEWVTCGDVLNDDNGVAAIKEVWDDSDTVVGVHSPARPMPFSLYLSNTNLLIYDYSNRQRLQPA